VPSILGKRKLGNYEEEKKKEITKGDEGRKREVPRL
jgi:hypothetical protein